MEASFNISSPQFLLLELLLRSSDAGEKAKMRTLNMCHEIKKKLSCATIKDET